MTKFIEILGAESPELYANVPDETGKAIMRVDEIYKNTRLAKPWVLTLFPTQGFAEMEQLDFLAGFRLAFDDPPVLDVLQ